MKSDSMSVTDFINIVQKEPDPIAFKFLKEKKN